MDTIRIGLAGDVMIGRLIDEYLEDKPSDYLWGDILPNLKATDLNLINLEAALTKSVKIVPKIFNFKADPKRVEVLKAASISIANLANNHVLDYSEEGLLETLQTLDNFGIKHVGAGRNFAEAVNPVVFEKKDLRIGIMGCTDNEPTWKATDTRPGTNYVQVGDLQSIVGNIKALRPYVDYLILSMHWGPNMRERPLPSFQQFAHELVDNGVDLIHGHSAHIFQGVEKYKGKLIIYDSGDFVDDYYVDPVLRNDRSFLFVIEIGKAGTKNLRMIPTLIKNFQVNKATGEDSSQALDRMQRLSLELGTTLTKENNDLVLII